MSLSPTKGKTTLALSPSTVKNSTSAVLQESNQKFELQYSLLLSDMPNILIPSPEIFPRGQGTKSK